VCHAQAFIPVAAIIGLVIIQVAALRYGIDGVMVYASISAIAGLGGFTLGRFTAPRGKLPAPPPKSG